MNKCGRLRKNICNSLRLQCKTVENFSQEYAIYPFSEYYGYSSVCELNDVQTCPCCMLNTILVKYEKQIFKERI